MEDITDKRKPKNGFGSFDGSSDRSTLENRESITCSRRWSCDSLHGNPTPKKCASPSPLGWPIRKTQLPKCLIFDNKSETTHLGVSGVKKHNMGSKLSGEKEMMKERFAKLLLGEDMSGSGKGVSSALAISNAITNLYAMAFGQLWRLEPLPFEKKCIWQREMECILCVSDHIVEFIPNWQTFPDGSKLEVMKCRPRADLHIDLPALRKLDNMLLEVLDSFSSTEFWYVDQGIITADAEKSALYSKIIQRQEEKWWLPVPRVPSGGLQKDTRKQLTNKRECANQILKAAMAINSITLAEMEVPESYLETLPKNARSSLGDVMYRYITSEKFFSECLLDCLDLSSEHTALDIANRVETSIHVWRRRLYPKPVINPNRSTAKSSWEMVKDLMVDGDKREKSLVERAESLLLCLKQRFPGLTQTTLDTSKIQCNKDVGKSILESYSRVLESLAFNIVARIDDLLYVDNITRRSGKGASVPTISLMAQKTGTFPYSVSASGTPYKSATATPKFSPARVANSPAKGDRSPFRGGNNKLLSPSRGFGVRRVLNNYLGGEAKVKSFASQIEEASSIARRSVEVPTPNINKENLEPELYI